MGTTVSIILPTYNRAAFLPDAVRSIREQRFSDWELIVVDDGSTDGTAEEFGSLSADIAQPVRYIFQENQGAYAARNTGLDHATGKYIAFFDSDDVWLPHHLRDCVKALEANSDVEWVYGACRVIEVANRRVTSENTFYVDERPLPFLKLRARKIGALAIIEDPDLLKCVLTTGLYAGLQNSVIRSGIFDDRRFCTDYRNEAEDAIFVAKVALAGIRFAYFDRPHVEYRIHGENSCMAGCTDFVKMERVLTGQLAICEDFLSCLSPHPKLQRLYARTLSKKYFWRLGYATYWQHGHHQKALDSFRKGIALNPTNIAYWKTFAAAWMQSIFCKTKS